MRPTQATIHFDDKRSVPHAALRHFWRMPIDTATGTSHIFARCQS